MPPALFALVILETGSCFMSRPAWTVIFLPTYAFHHHWNGREMEPHKLFAQAGLEPQASWSQPPKWLGLQAEATLPSFKLTFLRWLLSWVVWVVHWPGQANNANILVTSPQITSWPSVGQSR
jgi:hypothetical protein